MKYTVTLCVFDQSVGANPLWHGSFFLSKLDESKKMMEVVETWGFYGLTSTGDKNSRIEKLKRKNSIDVDFLPGNHGMLINEATRYMDQGHGLHGYNIELPEELFKEAQKRCQDVCNDQWNAIHEIVGDGSNFPTDPTRKGRIYPQEAYAKEIFQIEQKKAKIEGRPSRLLPFNMLSGLKDGFSFKKANTCKSTAVSILDGVLTEEQLAAFRSTAFPRFIPGLEPIFLHSTGPLREHKKESGDIVYFRDQSKDKEVKLYWTVPPQKTDALSENTLNVFKIDQDYLQKVRHLASKLQGVEWIIRNATVPEQFKKNKDHLIQSIVACYQAFAVIEPKEEIDKSKWCNFGFSMFGIPRNKDEKKLQDKVYQAEGLLNALYMAMADKWEIEPEVLADKAEEGTTPVLEESESSEPEALAACLSKKDKLALCKILNRNYVKDEEVQLKSESLAMN